MIAPSRCAAHDDAIARRQQKRRRCRRFRLAANQKDAVESEADRDDRRAKEPLSVVQVTTDRRIGMIIIDNDSFTNVTSITIIVHIIIVVRIA